MKTDMQALREAATAVMADFDEETTGNTNLDHLINVAMAHQCPDTGDLLKFVELVAADDDCPVDVQIEARQLLSKAGRR